MTPWSFFWQNAFMNLVSLGLLLVVAVTVSSVRHEPDPEGRRLTAAYLSVILFFSLFTAVLAGTAAVASTAEVVVGDSEWTGSAFSDDEFSEDDEEEEGIEDDVAAALRSLFLAGAAAAVLVYHRRRLDDLLDEDPDGPARRIFNGYLHIASAVALVTLVLGTSLGLFGFAKVLVPDAVSTQDEQDVRDEGVREMFTWGFLVVASWAVVAKHQIERESLDDDLDEEEPVA